MPGMPYDEKPIAQFASRVGRVKLWSDRIAWRTILPRRKDPDMRPLAGVRATVTPGERGFFASQQPNLTISGPGFEWPIDVKPYNVGDARTFAAHVNATASVLGEPARAAGGDVVSQLAKLAQLREAGLLSVDEFTAAKARLLFGDGGDGEGGALV